MLENKKSLIILISVASFGVCLFILYAIFTIKEPSGKETAEKTEFKGILVDKSSRKTPEFSGRDEIITPAIEAISEAITSTYESDDQSFENNNAQEPSNSTGNSSSESIAVSVRAFTEQDIFEFGYDKNHREFLESLRIEMVAYGFISESESYPITNMKEAIALQDKYADFIENISKNASGGGISSADMATYRKAYRELLPQLWEKELRVSMLSANSPWPINLIYKYQEISTREQLKKVTQAYRKRALSFIIPTANAQVSTAPFCYREGVNNFIPGSQRAAPCCNCGLYCSTGCSFVNDCGPGGGSCNVQLGCLNMACANLPAIWDPMTGICGCYI